MKKTAPLALALGLALVLTLAAAASVSLTQLSTDPYSNTTSQHRTEVEPDTFSNGSTVVGAFQAGRFSDGGATNVGWATTTNGGTTWTNGFLPGTTQAVGGPYDRDTDPSVGFDAEHDVWLISSLPLLRSKKAAIKGAAVLVNRSTDGGLTWSAPVTVAKATGGSDFDKSWSVCDNAASSPFYGSCYTEYDDFGHGNQVHVAYSRDGGLTWAQGTVPRLSVIGGQPLVQPSGTVIMPIDNGFETSVLSLRSTDGGVTWSAPVTIASISWHGVAGGLRSGPLPSAEVDGAGKVYVAWEDCRFETGCTANDIVVSTSTDGTTWSAVSRVPIDPIGSGVDHFLPGLAVDKGTSGGSAHLALAYYYYPVASCTSSTCQLDVGFVSSTNGGAGWSARAQLAGPMTLSWLPSTNQGRMVGDYISTSFAGGKAFPIFAVANAPTSGGTNCATATPSCDQEMYTPAAGLSPAGLVSSSRGELPVPGATSDQPAPSAPVARR